MSARSLFQSLILFMINDSLIVSLLQDKHEIEVEIAAHLQYVVLLRTKWLAMCRLACVVRCKRRHRYEQALPRVWL